MKSKILFSKLALAGCALVAATTIGRAQPTFKDTGTTTAPTPGANDIYQLLTGLANGDSGGFGGANYYDNNSGTSTPGASGSTFKTGSGNPGGYILNSITVKMGGHSDGGSDLNGTAQGWQICVYKLDNGAGTAVTNAVPIYNASTATATVHVVSNWWTFANLNLPLLANTNYAYTFVCTQSRSSSYDDIGYGTNNPYPNGAVCRILTTGGLVTIYTNSLVSSAPVSAAFDLGITLPTALTVGSPTTSAVSPVQQGTTVILTCGTVVDNAGNGTYTYQWQTDGGGGTLTNIPGQTGTTLTLNTAVMTLGPTYNYQVQVKDSTTATVNSSPVSIDVVQVLSGTLTDLGTATLPFVPGGSDAYQLNSAFTYQVSGNLNYYDDSVPASGQTFTTGSNAKGYSMNSVAIEMAGGSSGAPYTAGPNVSSAGMTNQAYDLRIYQISADTTTAYEIADVTNLLFSFANGHWIQWNFPAIILTNNVTYAYTLLDRNTANYCSMSTSDGSQDWYTGGQMVGIPNGGGGVTYSSSASDDATFDVGLVPNGVPFLLGPVTATPNPAYALSPVQLGCRPSTPGTYTYQWLTDDGTGATPPNYINMPGATATNVTVIPQDQGGDYTTNYYFVAIRTSDSLSVTSSVVALTVHAASLPVLTDPTPATLTTFVGGTVTYSVGEVGTLLMTNQWWADYGSGYTSITLRTNATLILNNVQTTNSGSYEMGATNSQGNAVTDPVTLLVLADPVAPNPASQKSFNMVYTNSPWAYWRLNDAGNPGGASTVQAFDYSGHGFFPTYGSAVTVNNAGPVPPSFPGFDAGELAAGTTVSTPYSYLTVPALHLNVNSNVTFMAWINPSGPQAANAGLLFNRNGGDAAGFGFGATSGDLGYTWNNNATTYNWDSGLAPASGEWNFVAYVITPTNTTVYLGNLNGGTNFYQSINPVANTAETFNGGTTLLGGDSQTVNRNFNGLICEAALFTNALTTLQVQQYFEAAIGATSLLPTVPALAVAPAAASGAGVYSGQNVRISAGNSSGTLPITNRWQVSDNGTTWFDVVGSNTNSLLLNPQTTGTLHYQLVVGNIAATVTSSPVVVTFNALPSTPAGLWTINFQTTNNIGPSQGAGVGLGYYVGRGILGNGMYWNVLPQLAGGWNSATIGSVSDLLDDGATHTGVYCLMGTGGAYNSLGSSGGGTLTYSSDVGNLLDQLFRTYYSGGGNNSALRFYGVPAGTYNLVCYGGNGVTISGAGNLGTTFVVYDSVNGNQTNSTAQASPTTDALAAGLNFCTFSNVHVFGGQLNVDVLANAAVAGSAPCMEGAQLQLVSYDNPPTNSVAVSGTYVSTNKTMTLSWPAGTLQTATNLLGPWTSVYAQPPGLSGALGTTPYAVTTTNGTQFFRVEVHP
jgi:hypothetical protein